MDSLAHPIYEVITLSEKGPLHLFHLLGILRLKIKE